MSSNKDSHNMNKSDNDNSNRRSTNNNNRKRNDTSLTIRNTNKNNRTRQNQISLNHRKQQRRHRTQQQVQQKGCSSSTITTKKRNNCSKQQLSQQQQQQQRKWEELLKENNDFMDFSFRSQLSQLLTVLEEPFETHEDVLNVQLMINDIMKQCAQRMIVSKQDKSKFNDLVKLQRVLLNYQRKLQAISIRLQHD